jgi:hypothetical protein
MNTRANAMEKCQKIMKPKARVRLCVGAYTSLTAKAPTKQMSMAQPSTRGPSDRTGIGLYTAGR